MTRDEVFAELDNLPLNEAETVTEAARLFRGWRGSAIDPAVIVDLMKQLRPAEVLAMTVFMQRKVSRRNRPR